MKSLIPARELAQLRSTVALISAYGRWIEFSRPNAAVSDGAGGMIRPVGPDPVLALQFMFFSAKANVSPMESNDSTGTQVVSDGVIVGMPRDLYGIKALDVQENDYFEFDGETYRVTFLHHDRRYQMKCECRVVTA